MDSSLFVGIGQVDILIRYARSLKDKRKIFQSLKQRLRNDGFSVVEYGPVESPKQGTLGVAYVGRSHAEVEQAFDRAAPYFLGDFEVISRTKEILDYASEIPDEPETDGTGWDRLP